MFEKMPVASFFAQPGHLLWKTASVHVRYLTHLFYLRTHVSVCTMLWNIGLLCSFGFLHVQCALTLFCKVGSALHPMVNVTIFLLL